MKLVLQLAQVLLVVRIECHGMVPVRRESLFQLHTTTANKWRNRHKKASRAKGRRYRDFIRKPFTCIKGRMRPRRVHIAFSCAHKISEGKRGGNEQPGADQQGEGDAAEH